MQIFAALTLTIAQIAQTPPFAPIEVESADKQCVARIDRESGQEHVAEGLAKYRLTVFARDEAGERRELWNSPYPFESGASKFVLADRGRAFAQIAEYFSETQTLVRVQARDREIANWNGAAFKIPGELLGGTMLERTWLAKTPAPSIAWSDSSYGPRLELQIACNNSLVRSIDLEHMSMVEKGINRQMARVEPIVRGSEPTRSGIPYVQSVELENAVRTGRSLEVKVGAAHASLGWTFLGFELEASGHEGRALLLTPRSAAPEGIAAQVLAPFVTTARLVDLLPGRYTLDVAGWSAEHKPMTFDVVPETLLAQLNTRGGFAGLDQRVEIFSQSVARLDPGRGVAARFSELSDGRMHDLRESLAALPALNRVARTKGAADLFQYRLSFWSSEHWITIEVDDQAATPEERALIQDLRSL